VATDPECRSRLQQDSAFFSDPDPYSKGFEKPGPEPESLFIFWQQQKLRGRYECHFFIKTSLEFGCIDDMWA